MDRVGATSEIVFFVGFYEQKKWLDDLKMQIAFTNLLFLRAKIFPILLFNTAIPLKRPRPKKSFPN